MRISSRKRAKRRQRQVFPNNVLAKRIVSTETGGVNSCVEVHFASYNCLQSLGFHVFDDLGINFSVAFIDTENDVFVFCSATTFAFPMARVEIRFVAFDLAGERRFFFAEVSNQRAWVVSNNG